MLIDDRIEAVILELDEFVRDYHSEYGEYALPIGDNPSMISMRAIIQEFFYSSLAQLAGQQITYAHETIVGQAEKLIEDDTILRLLKNLDQIATGCDPEELGLPIYEPRPSKEMIAEVRAFIKRIAGETMSKVEDYVQLPVGEGQPPRPATMIIRPAGQPIPQLQGANDLVLNQETMEKAVEYWLNATVFMASVKVYSIIFHKQSETYTVGFEPRKE